MYPGPCLHIELASDDMAELEIDSDDIKDVQLLSIFRSVKCSEK